MSTADFSDIAFARGPRKCERLFRAAISAFCTLTRPTRGELAQLDDLALGLFDSVSAEGRRFAAAALCECNPAPTGLVRRLCDEPVEISAPLLIRSRVLSDIDLIALIGRHGLPHARAIGRRNGLHPVVGSLVRALLARADRESASTPPETEPAKPEDSPLEAVRHQLRTVMQQAEDGEKGQANTSDRAQIYEDLREAALSGDVTAFTATLARVLTVSTATARRLSAGITYSDLLAGLRKLDLSMEEAFLLTAALYPAQVGHAAAIRLFIERYRAIDRERACAKVEAWCRQDQPDGLAEPHSLASGR